MDIVELQILLDSEWLVFDSLDFQSIGFHILKQRCIVERCPYKQRGSVIKSHCCEWACYQILVFVNPLHD